MVAEDHTLIDCDGHVECSCGEWAHMKIGDYEDAWRWYHLRTDES